MNILVIATLWHDSVGQVFLKSLPPKSILEKSGKRISLRQLKRYIRQRLPKEEKAVRIEIHGSAICKNTDALVATAAHWGQMKNIGALIYPDLKNPF